jgi:hypothetical protein
MKRGERASPAEACGVPFAAGLGAAILVMLAMGVFAQNPEKPEIRVDDDCAAFAAAPDGKIVIAVPHHKHIKKLEFVHTDLWVVEPNGSKKRILDSDKFMPAPPPTNFTVDRLSWSPDSKRIAADVRVETMSQDPDAPPNAAKSVALFDEEGQEIRVAGSKDRFIDNADSSTWLADGQSLVYLTGGGSYEIVRVRPATGETNTLFAGHLFDAVAWDAARSQAFVLSEDLSVTRRRFLIRLDLLHETIAEIARVDDYAGSLSVSPSAQKVGFFSDGDTIRVIEVADPRKNIEVHAGLGHFQWAPDEKRVLLKRGPADRSGDLVWVGIYDGSFTPVLHDLEFHDFQIEPNGKSLVVTQVGLRTLMVYPLG